MQMSVRCPNIRLGTVTGLHSICIIIYQTLDSYRIAQYLYIMQTLDSYRTAQYLYNYISDFGQLQDCTVFV